MKSKEKQYVLKRLTSKTDLNSVVNMITLPFSKAFSASIFCLQDNTNAISRDNQIEA